MAAQLKAPVPIDTARPLPIKKYAAAYGLHPSTIHRALNAGRLRFVTINKRRLILPPAIQTANAGA
jgi:hypothetical protein